MGIRNSSLEGLKSPKLIDNISSYLEILRFIISVEPRKSDVLAIRISFVFDALLILRGQLKKAPFKESPHIKDIDDLGNGPRLILVPVKEALIAPFETPIMAAYQRLLDKLGIDLALDLQMPGEIAKHLERELFAIADANRTL
jgi:hypothetical protein